MLARPMRGMRIAVFFFFLCGIAQDKPTNQIFNETLAKKENWNVAKRCDTCDSSWIWTPSTAVVWVGVLARGPERDSLLPSCSLKRGSLYRDRFIWSPRSLSLKRQIENLQVRAKAKRILSTTVPNLKDSKIGQAYDRRLRRKIQASDVPGRGRCPLNAPNHAGKWMPLCLASFLRNMHISSVASISGGASQSKSRRFADAWGARRMTRVERREVGAPTEDPLVSSIRQSEID